MRWAGGWKTRGAVKGTEEEDRTGCAHNRNRRRNNQKCEFKVSRSRRPLLDSLGGPGWAGPWWVTLPVQGLSLQQLEVWRDGAAGNPESLVQLRR